MFSTPMISAIALQEAEVLRLISRRTAGGGDQHSVVVAIANHLLSLTGINGVCLEVPQAAEASMTFGDAGPFPSSAIAEIAYGGTVFGTVRIGFDPQITAESSPIRTARFAGQQIGRFLLHSQLLKRQQDLKRQRANLAGRLETRKVFARAVALLQGKHNLSEQEARRFLFASARKLRKPLRYTAHTVVTLESGLLLRIKTNTREERVRHASRWSVS